MSLNFGQSTIESTEWIRLLSFSIPFHTKFLFAMEIFHSPSKRNFQFLFKAFEYLQMNLFQISSISSGWSECHLEFD